MAHVNSRVAGVQGTYPVLERKKFTTPVTSVAFDNLKGDAASVYRIEGYIVSEVISAVFLPHLTINGDSSGDNNVDGNYREIVVNLDAAYGTTVAADQNEFFWGGTSYPATHVAMLTIEIFAKSGHASHAIRAEVHNADSSQGKTQLTTGSWDVADEITSIEIFAGGGPPFNLSTFSGDLQLSYMG